MPSCWRNSQRVNTQSDDPSRPRVARRATAFRGAGQARPHHQRRRQPGQLRSRFDLGNRPLSAGLRSRHRSRRGDRRICGRRQRAHGRCHVVRGADGDARRASRYQSLPRSVGPRRARGPAARRSIRIHRGRRGVHRRSARACLPAAARGGFRVERFALQAWMLRFRRLDRHAGSARGAHDSGSAGAEAAFRDSVAVRGRSSRASEDRVRPPDLRPRFRGCATSSRRASRPLWYRRAPGHPGGARLRGRPVRFPPAPALRLLAPVPRGRNSARRRLRRPRSRSEHHLSLLRGNPAGRLAPAVQAQLHRRRHLRQRAHRPRRRSRRGLG